LNQLGLAGRQIEVQGRDRDVAGTGVGEAAGIDICDTIADELHLGLDSRYAR
jgi:hypothetical protein